LHNFPSSSYFFFSVSACCLSATVTVPDSLFTVCRLLLHQEYKHQYQDYDRRRSRRPDDHHHAAALFRMSSFPV
jgi:hypothetical protein